MAITVDLVMSTGRSDLADGKIKLPTGASGSRNRGPRARSLSSGSRSATAHRARVIVRCVATPPIFLVDKGYLRNGPPRDRHAARHPVGAAWVGGSSRRADARKARWGATDSRAHDEAWLYAFASPANPRPASDSSCDFRWPGWLGLHQRQNSAETAGPT
jgi:hypothetical protein